MELIWDGVWYFINQSLDKSMSCGLVVHENFNALFGVSSSRHPLFIFWKYRNSYIFNGTLVNWSFIYSSIVPDIKAAFSIKFKNNKVANLEWHNMVRLAFVVQENERVYFIKWMKPYIGCFVLNTDGCTKGNPRQIGGGGILCDTNGNMLLAYSCYLGSLTSVHAEVNL